MFKRILVPLDGSSVAEGILPYIRTLATALGARADLLRTFQNPAHELVITDDLGSPNLVTGLEGLVDQLHHQADEYLQEVAKGLESAGISTTTNVRSGPAAQHIVNEAEPAEETLIAMSTHGRTGVGRLIIGSVTDRVLHTVKTPLLVVRSGGDPPASQTTASVKTIIVPLDGSDLAETVIPIVVELAKATSAEVLLVWAVSVAASYYSASDYPTQGNVNLLEDMENEAEQYLGERAESFRKSGVSSVRTAVLRGGAAVEIENLSQETPDCMIVICTHGRSGVGRTVLGSIADRLARHSGNPVLLVQAAE